MRQGTVAPSLVHAPPRALTLTLALPASCRSLLVGNHAIGSSIVAMDVCQITGLVALASSSGVVRLVDASVPNAMRTVFRSRLHKAAVKQVRARKRGAITCGCASEGSARARSRACTHEQTSRLD